MKDVRAQSGSSEIGCRMFAINMSTPNIMFEYADQLSYLVHGSPGI